MNRTSQLTCDICGYVTSEYADLPMVRKIALQLATAELYGHSRTAHPDAYQERTEAAVNAE